MKTTGILACLLIAASPEAASAQTQSPATPAREGNIWGGVAHQPTQGQVGAEERANGVAPPPQQQKALNNDVEGLYRQLLRQNTPGGNTPGANPPAKP